jgi:hypothetical protein
MKTRYMKYLLLSLALLCMSTGCRNESSRIDFILDVIVFWGENLAVGDSVNVKFGGQVDTTVTGIFDITDSLGECQFYYAIEYPSRDEEVPYGVRAQDSLGVWSEYKEGIMKGDNPGAQVYFHL